MPRHEPIFYTSQKVPEAKRCFSSSLTFVAMPKDYSPIDVASLFCETADVAKGASGERHARIFVEVGSTVVGRPNDHPAGWPAAFPIFIEGKRRGEARRSGWKKSTDYPISRAAGTDPAKQIGFYVIDRFSKIEHPI